MKRIRHRVFPVGAECSSLPLLNFLLWHRGSIEFIQQLFSLRTLVSLWSSSYWRRWYSSTSCFDNIRCRLRSLRDRLMHRSCWIWRSSLPDAATSLAVALAPANRLALNILCGWVWLNGVASLVRRGFVSRRFSLWDDLWVLNGRVEF